ncbi:MAG: hypothetical protein ABIJ86_08325 [Spirochaetota bacterium]
MVLFEKPGYLTVVHEETKGYVMFKWEKFGISLEDIKVAHKAGLETAKDKNCLYYIAETSAATGALQESVIGWFTKEWVPTLHKEGLVAIVTVVPESSAVARFSTKSWQAGDFSGIIMENVHSIKEAEDLLSKIKAKKHKLF